MPKTAPETAAKTAAETCPAPWRTFAVACKKCGKKLRGGFGPDGDEKLGRAVRSALRDAGQRRALRLVETGCLGLCPKGRVTVLRADRPGELLALPGGLHGAALLARLLPEPSDPVP